MYSNRFSNITSRFLRVGTSDVVFSRRAENFNEVVTVKEEKREGGGVKEEEGISDV